MEFEEKMLKGIIRYFLGSLVIGVGAYLAVLFGWGNLMAIFYAMNAINW